MRIVSWQSVLTDHQSHTLRAFQEISGVELVVVSGTKMLSEREKQGWKQPDLTGLDVRHLPSERWWREGKGILHQYNDAIHLFNGMWTDRRFLFFLLYARRYGFNTYLVTEPYADQAVGLLSDVHVLTARLKTVLRSLIYQLVGRLLVKRMQAVFAISEKAVDQFVRMGVPRARIFPFGYFVPCVDNSFERQKQCTDIPNVVFVGGLLKRKGIHVLRDALDILGTRKSMVVDIYGPGDANVVEGSPKLQYRGVIPFGQAQKTIAEYDLLVLPSLFDGWGVVVNEALMQGVPVIVSDQVGAKILVKSSGAGAIFPAGNPEALAKQLEAVIDSPVLLASWKSNAISVGKRITPEIAARYMHQILMEDYSECAANPWCPS